MNAVLIRHTRIVGSAGLCYGQADLALAESFPEEAAEVATRLPWVPQRVLTSPATRCRRLAESIAGAVPVTFDPRLRELHMGTWEGRPWESFRGELSEAWALDPWNVGPPGGETAAALWARVAALRDEIRKAEPSGLAIVTHAGVIRAWLGLATGRSLPEMMAVPVPFGSVQPAP